MFCYVNEFDELSMYRNLVKKCNNGQKLIIQNLTLIESWKSLPIIETANIVGWNLGRIKENDTICGDLNNYDKLKHLCVGTSHPGNDNFSKLIETCTM